MAFHNIPKIVTDGLQLCVDTNDPNSYPGSGTTWTDVVSGTTFAPDEGAPVYISTPIKCFDFQGQASPPDNLYSSGQPATNSQTQYTRMVWFNADELHSGFGGPMIQNYIGNNADMCVMYDGNRLKFYHYNASGGESGNAGDTTLTPGVWYCGAISVNRDVASDNLRFYINGVADGTANRTDLNNASSNTLYIGGPGVDAYSGGRYFNGKIAAVYHYNKILSAAEVQQNFNAQRSRFGI